MDQLLESLPETLRSFVDREVASGKYPDVKAFVVELIATERKKRLLEEVESMIEEGHASGEPTAFTHEDWTFIRSEVRSRLARAGSAP